MYPDSDKIKKLEYDVVVIGGGGAGLSAAVTVAENSKKRIIVLEKRSSLGGNTALATGLFACESPVQRREKIIADRDSLFEKTMDWAHWDGIDPRISRAFINKSGETIRWLEEKGINFSIRPFYPNQEPRVWHCPEGRGAHLVKVLGDNSRELGVRILLNAGASGVFKGKHGNINRVLASENGNRLEIKTDSVIITTGGFAGNNELLKKYCVSYYEGMPLRGLPLMGDGLEMASGVDAAIEDSVTLLKEGPRMTLHLFPDMGLVSAPTTIWVNSLGKRFINEVIGFHPFESVNPILRQPGHISFTIFDDSIRRHFEENGIKMGRVLKDADGQEGLRTRLAKEAEQERVKISESLDDIADWISADRSVLRDTINEYNTFCEKGYDETFAKERKYLLPIGKAPFYAIKGLPTFLDTLGGIRINEHMEVLDHERVRIPGLYSAGSTTSGWEGEHYCGDLSGSAFGYAINSGRIAGESVIRFLSGR